MKIRMVKIILVMVVKKIINNDHDNHVFEYLTITDHEFSDDFYDNLTAGTFMWTWPAWVEYKCHPQLKENIVSQYESK